MTLPLANARLEELLQPRLERVEQELREAVEQSDKFANETSKHLVVAGGKRLRPLLTLLAAELGEGDNPEVVTVAVVAELTHLATLYHDDVMDSAPTRRGAPAAHEVWGNTVAILTGDLLFARASMLVAELDAEAAKVQAATFERLCLGQIHETVGPADGQDPVEHYLQVLADKTGSLLGSSARLGAFFGKCDAKVVAAVTAFGELVGVAFQLADDVIDIRSSAAETGKTPGTDLREGVATMPVLLLRARVAAGGDPADAALLARIEGNLADDDVLAGVVADLATHPVLDETSERAREWAKRAVDCLDDLPPSDVKDAFGSFADAMVARGA